jgi:hypothetical protein
MSIKTKALSGAELRALERSGAYPGFEPGGGAWGAVGGVAGGLISGGATLLGGYLQNKANEKMNRDNLRLA